MYARAAALLVGCVLALSGCAAGAGQGPQAAVSTANATGFNAADVMFLQMMVPHHGQGMRIVGLARTRTIQPDVRMLVAAIEATQTTEVERMSGWLRAWGQPPTADAGAHAAHGGMPDTTAAEFSALENAPAADFERRFLNTMIAHQDDAIQMARAEIATGVNPQARELAGQIDKSRSAQIAQLLKATSTITGT